MAAGLTLATLYNRVAYNVQDVDSSGTPLFEYWAKAWIINWLNDAMQELCAEVQLLKQFVAFGQNPNPVLQSNATAEYVPTVQVGTPQPNLPTGDNLALDQIVLLQAGNLTLQQSSMVAIASLYQDWDTHTGTPMYFVYNDWAPGVVRVFPDPGTTLTTLRGICTLKPALLVNDGDTPPLDSEFHQALEFYATARCLLMDAETQDIPKAQIWMQMYEAKKARLKTKQSSNFSVSQRLVPSEGF